MLFVAAHTTIPCPKVYRTYRRNDGLFIEMEFIPGTNLEEAWDAGLPETTRQRICETVRGYVEQLRSLKAPSDFAVGSVSGGPVKGSYLSPSIQPPFGRISHFLSIFTVDMSESEVDALNRRVGFTKRTYRSKFSHADICPRNFILQDNGNLVLIDWELAGWWPEFWEYTKAHFAVFKEHPGWLDLIEKAVPVYSVELEKYRILLGYQGVE